MVSGVVGPRRVGAHASLRASVRAKRVADVWDESNDIDPSVCVGPATRLQHLVSDFLAARSIPDLRSQGKKNKLEVRAWATPSACAGMMKDEKGGGTDLIC